LRRVVVERDDGTAVALDLLQVTAIEVVESAR
jgi:hypothetical protein